MKLKLILERRIMKTLSRWPRKMTLLVACLVVSVFSVALLASFHPTDAYAGCSEQVSTATGGGTPSDIGADQKQSSSFWDWDWFKMPKFKVPKIDIPKMTPMPKMPKITPMPKYNIPKKSYF